MYVNKEIVANSSSNEKGIKIGPDAIRFKYVDDEIVKHSPLYVEGIIFAVGLDFVEVLQKDHKIVTVLTDRITHVKWPDKEVREAVSHCKHDGNCRCVELHRFVEEDIRGDKMNKNLKCSKKVKNRIKGYHCPHCGNYQSRLNPCRCKMKQRNHGRPCGCKQNNSRHDYRPCGCKEDQGQYHHCTCCRDEHHNRHMYHHDCCQKKLVCFCDFAIPFCDDRFALRIAGLTDDLNFRFLQNRGRHVEMIVE